MPEIYRSAALTIVINGTINWTDDSYIDSSILEQPFSIFLDWSRPTVAKSFSDRLLAPNILRQRWIIEEPLWSKPFFARYKRQLRLLIRRHKRAVNGTTVRTQTIESSDNHEDNPDTNRLDDTQPVPLEVDTIDKRLDEASHSINRGGQYIGDGKSFEALALFMKARELISAFQTLTPRSWKAHALASTHIALVYQMQNLRATALEIAEASLAMGQRLPVGDLDSSFE